MRPGRFFCMLLASVLAVPSGHAAALLTYNTVFEANGYPSDGASLGWQFRANQAAFVTHLGLYDDAADGFDVEHPVGLYRVSDGVLLTSGIVHAGTVDTLLLNGFRYVDVPDVALVAGQEYVVAYFTSDPAGVNRDHMIASWDYRTVDPAITLGYGRWQAGTTALTLPANIDLRGVYFVGPNALIAAVPLPAAAWLFGGALGALGLVRRRSGS